MRTAEASRVCCSMMCSELTFIAGPMRDSHVALCVGCHAHKKHTYRMQEYCSSAQSDDECVFSVTPIGTTHICHYQNNYLFPKRFSQCTVNINRYVALFCHCDDVINVASGITTNN